MDELRTPRHLARALRAGYITGSTIRIDGGLIASILTQEESMLLTSSVRGVLPIAPTPFFDDGTVDASSIDRLVDFYLSIGATGVTVLGQLGEAPKLEHSEAVAIATQVIRRIGAAGGGRRFRAGIRRDARTDPRGHGSGRRGSDDRPAEYLAHR